MRGGVAMVDTLVVALLALAAAGLPVVAHLLGPAWGIGLCAVLAATIANFAPAAVPATILASFLFQNLFVSLISPWIASPAEFNAVRAYNFLTTATMWLVLGAAYWTGRPDLRSPAGRLMVATSGALGLVAVYFAIGLAGDATSAAIYLRNIATPLLAFQVCLVATARARLDPWPTLKPLGLLLLAYGYGELLARSSLFGLIHADQYLGFSMRQQIESGIWQRTLQETGQVIRSYEDTLKIDLLNTPLLSGLRIQLYRLLGPNFHSISFAYALSFFSLAFLAGRRAFYLLLALPLLVAIGSKGALLCCLTSAAALLALRVARPSSVMTLVVVLLVLSSALAVLFGLRIGDYHAVGLVGGINGFLSNPFGHGLGSGGNLSTDMTRIDWSRSQQLGETSVAVESAIGVLLYQMGIAGLAVALTPVAVAWSAWRRFRAGAPAAFAIIAFAVLCITANGLLQEEALFAPLALGSLMAFAGMAFGSLPGPVSRART